MIELMRQGVIKMYQQELKRIHDRIARAARITELLKKGLRQMYEKKLNHIYETKK